MSAKRLERTSSGMLLLVTLAVGGLGLIAPRAGAQNRSEFVATLEFSARLRQRLQHLNRLRGQQLWKDWVEQYQSLVDEYPDGVLPRDEEFYIGLRHYLAGELEALPPQVKQLYRQRFDGEARDLYQKAVAARDEGLMRQVYGRFRHTSVGAPALEWLAARALDNGDPEIARLAYGRAVREGITSPVTLLRYGIAALAAGRPQEAQQAFRRAETEFGPQQLRLGGKDTTVAAAARQLGRTPPPRTAAGQNFHSPDGLRQLSGQVKGPLTKRWEHVFPVQVTNPISGVRYQAIMAGITGRSRLSYLTFPLLLGEQVVLQGPRSITSVRLADGQERWSNRDFDFDLAAEDGPQPAIRGRVIYYRTGPRPIQSVLAAQGGLVFARMPITINDSARRGRFPGSFALMALDGATGRPLWRQVSIGEEDSEIWNMPVVLDNLVFTGTARATSGITEFRAVALRAGTGDLVWSTYLGGGTDPMTMADGSPAAVRDGMLWIESTLHTLNGLDLVTGEIRYVYRYQPRRSSYANSGWVDLSTVANEPVSLLPAGGKRLVFAPRWGDQVVAFDPTAGRLLWSAPKTASPTLFAVDGERAYLCGQDIQAYELETGAKVWSWVPPGRPGHYGFAALANGKIYAPVEGKIHVLDAADGRELAVLETPEVGESPGYTSVTVSGNRLIVVTREKAICYEGAP